MKTYQQFLTEIKAPPKKWLNVDVKHLGKYVSGFVTNRSKKWHKRMGIDFDPKYPEKSDVSSIFHNVPNTAAHKRAVKKWFHKHGVYSGVRFYGRGPRPKQITQERPVDYIHALDLKQEYNIPINVRKALRKVEKILNKHVKVSRIPHSRQSSMPLSHPDTTHLGVYYVPHKPKYADRNWHRSVADKQQILKAYAHTELRTPYETENKVKNSNKKLSKVGLKIKRRLPLWGGTVITDKTNKIKTARPRRVVDHGPHQENIHPELRAYLGEPRDA